LNDYCNTIAQISGAFVDGFSAAAGKFVEQVAAEGGKNVVTAERQAEILAQTLGRL